MKARDAGFWALGVLLVALVTLGAVQLPAGDTELGGTAMEAFVAIELGAGIVWVVVCWMAARAPPRRAVPGVLILALLMRLVPLIGPPLLSSDVYRYVWDGRVQAAGINPYRYKPADPALAGLRDSAVYPNINRAIEARTIYPPAAQMLFRVAAAVSPGVRGMKWVMVVMEGVALAFMLALLRRAGRPAALLAMYAWAPLPVWEFAGDGHIDAASLAWIGGALLAAASGRRGWAGFAIAGGGLTKVLPLAIGPALWRRWDWRLPVAAAVTLGAGYAVYASVGLRVFGYLPGYGAEEGLESGSGVLWLRIAGLLGRLPEWAGSAWLVVAAIFLLAFAAWVAWRQPASGALLLAGATMFIVSPHYPWYLCWVTYLTVLWVRPWAVWLTVFAPLLYFDPAHRDLLWPVLVFVPAALLFARDLFRRA